MRRNRERTTPFPRAALVDANQRGSALGITTMFVVVMLISALTLIQMGSTDAVLASRENRSADALYTAESGVQRAQAWLRAQNIPPEDLANIYPFGEAACELSNGSYTVVIKPFAGNATSDRKLYTIVSCGSVGGVNRTIEVDVEPKTLAAFLYFTDFEHEPASAVPAWFTSADYIDGPLHTNDQISIFGDPIFRGEVTSTHGGPDDNNDVHEPKFLYYNGDAGNHIESNAPTNAPYDEPTFDEGYQLGAQGITLPNGLAECKTMAMDGGLAVAGNYEFYMGREVDGSPMLGYISYRKKNEGEEDWVDLDLSSINGMIYVNGSVDMLGGVLDGQLTISSNGAIGIHDDLTYLGSDENGPFEDCDDILGLVSAGDIVIHNTVPNNDDCVIHAHMIALNTSFKAENYNVGDPRGYLTVYGGIVQQYRGIVGTAYLLNGEAVVLTGYAKDYHYDYRLQDMQPPGYYDIFQTGIFKRLAWREVDTV